MRKQIEEIWLPIKGYEGLYEISSIGRVKSLSRSIPYNHHLTNERLIRITSDKILSNRICRGYHFVSLQKKNGNKSFRVCRLVATAFIPNPENKPQVNHKNGVKEFDFVENLEWCTPIENMQHALKNNLLNIKSGADKSTSKKVKCLRTGKIFNTIKDFAKERKIDSSNIVRALNGTYKNNHDVEYYY